MSKQHNATALMLNNFRNNFLSLFLLSPSAAVDVRKEKKTARHATAL